MDVSHAVLSDLLSSPQNRPWPILFTSAVWLSLPINKNIFWLTRIIINCLENSLAIPVKFKAYSSQEADVPHSGL